MSAATDGMPAVSRRPTTADGATSGISDTDGGPATDARAIGHGAVERFIGTGWRSDADATPLFTVWSFACNTMA